MSNPLARLPILRLAFEDPAEKARRRREEAAAREKAVIALPQAPLSNTPFEPWAPRSPFSVSTPEEQALVEKLLAEVDPADIFELGAPLLTDRISPRRARVELSYYVLDETYYSTVIVYGWPPVIHNRLLDPLLQLNRVTLSMHKLRIPTRYAAKQLRLQKQKLELVLKQHSTDSVEYMSIAARIEEADKQIALIGRREAAYFHISAYIRVAGDSQKELADSVHEVHEQLKAMGCLYRDVPGDQAEGFLSTMPYADDRLSLVKNFTSLNAADLFPFQSREIDMKNGVLYGVHSYNFTPVIATPFVSDVEVDTVTAVLGTPGGGKTFWIRSLMGRLGQTGAQIIAIDPVGGFRLWFERNKGQIIEFYPGSKFHVNPFKLAVEANGQPERIDDKIALLKPLFRLLLGDREYEEYHADTAIDAGLKTFYERYGTEERLMIDFLEVMKERAELTAGSRRDDLLSIATALTERCIEGSYREFFNHPTNVRLDSGRILFNLEPSKGEHKTYATYMAITMAQQLAISSQRPKVLVIDEAHEVITGNSQSGALDPIVDSLLTFPRRGRHWRTAMFVVTQFFGTSDSGVADPKDKAMLSILTLAQSWVLFRMTPAGIQLAQRQSRLPEEMAQQLRMAGRNEEGGRPRFAIYWSRDTATPMYTVGLDYEIAEDVKPGSTRED